jgi:hypothetical protein
MITYQFILQDGRFIEFEVDLDRREKTLTPPEDRAEWTRLGFGKCPNCPLLDSEHTHCPAAVDVQKIVTAFKTTISHTRARIEVITPERAYVKDSDVQTGLRSLLGLVMATSGCPYLSQLKGLALTHLPFATLGETIFRTVGFYLIRQYLRMRAGEAPDLELRGLDDLYQALQTVNRHFNQRLQAASEKDANLNAITSLQYVSVGVSYSLEDHLEELKTWFAPGH